MDVVEDGVGVPSQTFVRGGVNGAAPASLVEGGNLDGVGRGGEGGKERIVGVAVVAGGEWRLVGAVDGEKKGLSAEAVILAGKAYLKPWRKTRRAVGVLSGCEMSGPVQHRFGFPALSEMAPLSYLPRLRVKLRSVLQCEPSFLCLTHAARFLAFLSSLQKVDQESRAVQSILENGWLPDIIVQNHMS